MMNLKQQICKCNPEKGGFFEPNNKGTLICSRCGLPDAEEVQRVMNLKQSSLTIVTVEEKCYNCLGYKKIKSCNCVDGVLANSNCPICGRLVTKTLLTEGD